jgi:hypothetical protein
MKIPGPQGVITVRGRQTTNWKVLRIHEFIIAPEESKILHMLANKNEAPMDPSRGYVPKSHPEGELESIPLIEEGDSRCAKLAGDLPSDEEVALVSLLQRNADLFTYSPSDMTGIPREVIQH